MWVSFFAEKDFTVGSQQQTSPTIPRISREDKLDERCSISRPMSVVLYVSV